MTETRQEIDFAAAAGPEAVRASLERRLGQVLAWREPDPLLRYEARWATGPVLWTAELSLRAVTRRDFSYRFAATLQGDSPERLASWFGFWAGELTAAPPAPGSDSTLYAAAVEAARAAEVEMADPERLRARILEAFHGGAVFVRSHKEGHTRFSGRHGRYERADAGEWNARERFATAQAFLDQLRAWAPLREPEEAVWRLVWRELAPPV